MPPHDMSSVHRINQALGVVLKLMEVILLGDINVRLTEPRNYREDDLVTALAGSGLTDVKANFAPIQRYRGTDNWNCQIRR